MTKRMLLWAPALLALGCGGAAKPRDNVPTLKRKKTKRIKKPEEMERRRAPVGRDDFDSGGIWIKRRLLLVLPTCKVSAEYQRKERENQMEFGTERPEQHREKSGGRQS